MKTQTEKELEREIERLRNIRLEKRKIGEEGQTINNVALEGLAEAKLEGYRLAKEEFNKKVEKLKEEIEPILMIRTTFEDLTIKEQKDLIFEKINKIFKEEKSNKKIK